MLIIELKPLENGTHRNQTWDSFMDVPEGWAKVPPELEDKAMSFLPFIELTVEGGAITDVSQGTIPQDTTALTKVKEARVAQSKSDLESYLASHPITWTDGNQYSITREKQQQLTSKILSAVLAAQTSTPYDLTWNATGEECITWTLEELSALAFAIDARVTALVSYQQKKEVEILAAQTLEELERIEVDYDTVE